MLFSYLNEEFIEWAVEKISSGDFEFCFCKKCGILDEVLYKEHAIYDVIKEETTRWANEREGPFCPNCEKAIIYSTNKSELIEWLMKFAEKDPEGVEAELLKELAKRNLLTESEKKMTLIKLI